MVLKNSPIYSRKFTLTKSGREAQVTALISELKPMVTDIGDATLIVPLIKEYMEIGVKNDDALIKMATLVQRALNSYYLKKVV